MIMCFKSRTCNKREKPLNEGNRQETDRIACRAVLLRAVIDIVADCSFESFTKWLRQHPEIEVVSGLGHGFLRRFTLLSFSRRRIEHG